MPKICKYLEHINSFVPTVYGCEVSSQIGHVLMSPTSAESNALLERKVCIPGKRYEDEGLQSPWGLVEGEESQRWVQYLYRQYSMEALTILSGIWPKSFSDQRHSWLVVFLWVQEFKSLLSSFLNLGQNI